MANNFVDPGRGQPLTSFERKTADAKKESLRRHDHLLFRGYAEHGEAERPTDKYDAEKLALQYTQVDLEVSEVVAALFGASDGQLGRIGTLEAINNQADFLATRHRADTLRATNFVRRIAHAAARRSAYHRVNSGYVDKRLVKNTVEKLRESMS